MFFLDRSHNTHRWIKLGVLSFQPSELAKPAIILFMAHFLESRLRSITDLRHTLLPAVAPTAVFCVLIVAQPDLGTAMTCAFITAAILFISGMEMEVLRLDAAGNRGVPLYFLLFRTAWRARRMVAFINPYADPQGAGFHIIQSLIAVGTGGLTGLGLMEGKQKLFYLPEPQTDFIFAVVSEELGLIGAVCFVAAFAFFCFRGLRAAWQHARQLRPPAGRRHHGHDRHPGLLQHQRGARTAAHQGDSAAVHLLRRLVAHRHPGQRGSAAQHHAADGLI